MFAGERLVMGGIAPPYIGAWLPTMVFAIATIAVVWTDDRRLGLTTGGRRLTTDD
jgi:lipopolysaccharide export LptBFGC system permease protein LptF